MNPEQLQFNESHEWVGVNTENGQEIALVGITDFALEQLTDLVYMQLPAVGDTVTQGQQFGEVESVKAVSPLYSPVTGKVVSVHNQLVDQLESLAKDPFGEGWMIKVELQEPVSGLLDYQSYRKQCAS
jgi:glycine cleavage system H protein